MRKHLQPAIIWAVVVLLVGYAARATKSCDDHVPRFINGVSYAESAYAVTRQLRNETHVLRSYVRQLPWPEDGWIFREWSEDKHLERWVITGSGERFEEYSTTPVDSAWITCSGCGKQELRYELRSNDSEAHR